MGRLIEIYTDGACSQNGTWEGGWGFFHMTDNFGCMGYEKDTTNNRMELTAVIKALESVMITEDFSEDFVKTRIIIYTDSSYVANAYNKKWIVNWKRNGWRNSKKETVKNMDLWRELDHIVSNEYANYSVEFVKVKGHSGVRGNEIADDLATTAIKRKMEKPMLVAMVDKQEERIIKGNLYIKN